MATLDMLESEVSKEKSCLISRRAEHGLLSKSLEECSSLLSNEAGRATLLSDSIIMAQTFSGSIQTGVIKQFESLLTRAIRQIFGRDYVIDIEFQTKGNSFWADFYVTLPNGRRVSLSNGEGGGLKDLCSVLNRILYLVIDPTQPAKIVFLDENLADMDEWRSPQTFQLLVKIMTDLGLQAIWVTHNESVSSGNAALEDARIIKMHLENDKTVCELVTATP